MNSFAFERDFSDSLRCIPMSVRFKLDRCGIKLSLRQWIRLVLTERKWLSTSPCDKPAEIAAMRLALAEMIERIPGETVKRLEDTRDAVWTSRSVPPEISHQCFALGIAQPTRAQWSGLTELQRFALVKLTREGHDNANFLPAMAEFGLVRAEAATV